MKRKEYMEWLKTVDHDLWEYQSWTGPRDGMVDSEHRLHAPVDGLMWPYGPPSRHQPCCLLHAGGLYCDCLASDASEEGEWGMPS